MRFYLPKRDNGFFKGVVFLAALSGIGHLIWLLTTDFDDIYGVDSGESKSYVILTFLSCLAVVVVGVYKIFDNNSKRRAKISMADSYLLRTQNICECPFALTCLSGHQFREEKLVCWCFDLEDALNAQKIVRNAYSEEGESCLIGAQIYDEKGRKCLDSEGRPF